VQVLRFVILKLTWLLFQYVAGFDKGGTSLFFWENVYDFSTACVGEEVAREATQAQTIDGVDSKDVITTYSLIQVLSTLFSSMMCSYKTQGTDLRNR